MRESRQGSVLVPPVRSESTRRTSGPKLWKSKVLATRSAGATFETLERLLNKWRERMKIQLEGLKVFPLQGVEQIEANKSNNEKQRQEWGRDPPLLL